MLAQFSHQKLITNKWRHIRESDLRCRLRQLSHLNKQPIQRDPHFHQHVHLLLLLQNSTTTLIMRAEDFMELNTIICPISRATSSTLSTEPNPAALKLQLGAMMATHTWPPHMHSHTPNQKGKSYTKTYNQVQQNQLKNNK